ncbi:hypothetical protein GCM10009569_31600 [Arthrobacter russicus]
MTKIWREEAAEEPLEGPDNRENDRCTTEFKNSMQLPPNAPLRRDTVAGTALGRGITYVIPRLFSRSAGS